MVILILCSLSTMVFANAGPTYWKGYPSSDIMFIKDNLSIKIENENLIFDFSNSDKHSHTIMGRTTAIYEMLNESERNQSVQMAFPFIGSIRELPNDDIVIFAGEDKIPYEIYIGDVVYSYGDPYQKEKEAVFDFKNIVNTITRELIQTEHFKEDDKGKLYTIHITPIYEERVNFVLDINSNSEKTTIITKGFSGYAEDNGDIQISAWCYEPETLEIYVLGEDIDINISAYADWEKKKKTDLYTYKTITEMIQFSTYLMESVKEYPHRSEHENTFSDVQLYNLYANTLDGFISRNMNYVNFSDLMAQDNYQRIFTLVYNVEFSPLETKEISVKYKSSSTMDRTKTSDPIYTVNYILNPAGHWENFKDLHIKIIPPEQAPYIIKSSIDFIQEDNNYIATLSELPKEDLTFTFYGKEEITLSDKIKSKFDRVFGYMFFLLVYGAPILIIGSMVILLYNMKRKTHI